MRQWEVKHAMWLEAATGKQYRANNEAWISEGGFVVANVYHGAVLSPNDKMEREVVDRNAYLMAAAPELLKALETLVWVFSESGMYDTEVFDDARKAIAYAKGENKQ